MWSSEGWNRDLKNISSYFYFLSELGKSDDYFCKAIMLISENIWSTGRIYTYWFYVPFHMMLMDYQGKMKKGIIYSTFIFVMP
jgi:hypothetical protein